MNKTIKSLLGFVVVVATAFLSAHFYSSTVGNKNSSFNPAPNGSLSLISEPEDGIQPELNLINGAKKSIDLVMYELEDSQIDKALVIAHDRGVNVRVLLNKGYNGTQSLANEPAYTYLSNHRVAVRWAPSYFSLTHQKTLVVDNNEASIMTFNFTPQYYGSSRDFAINDSDQHDVAAIVASFDSDWYSERLTAQNGDDLIWSPGSENSMINLINSAHKSLEIYNEEMADTNIVSALKSAASRGVNVEITMTYSSNWKVNFNQLKSAGVHIHTFNNSSKAPYIHAKMILVDDQKAFIGSENFSTTSLNKNKELGIELVDKPIIGVLNSTFNSDFQQASAF